jgi:hypothetical protein
MKEIQFGSSGFFVVENTVQMQPEEGLAHAYC